MAPDFDPTKSLAEIAGGSSSTRFTEPGHYRILEELGHGGMGVVYRAEDVRLKRPVALKFLSIDRADDPIAKERFIREAQAASSLDHLNLCTIYEIDETADGELFLAMALYEGETLKERIARGPLTLDDALDLAIQPHTDCARHTSMESFIATSSLPTCSSHAMAC